MGYHVITNMVKWRKIKSVICDMMKQCTGDTVASVIRALPPGVILNCDVFLQNQSHVATYGFGDRNSPRSS